MTYTDGDADQGKTASYQDQREPEYIYVGSSLTSRSRTESTSKSDESSEFFFNGPFDSQFNNLVPIIWMSQPKR